nr:DUF1330 domain-containing protein [Streptomyces sp. I05A-00742]
MPAYALARMEETAPHADVAEYIERVQETLDPYEGRFVAHGGETDVREGVWTGAVAMVAFPDLERARAWYDSPAYQAILPLRARHVPGDLVLFEGVEDGYRPAVRAAALRAALAG